MVAMEARVEGMWLSSEYISRASELLVSTARKAGLRKGREKAISPVEVG